MSLSVLDKRRAMVDQIASAVTSISERTERNDPTDLIDWCITIQIVTAELMATAVTDITNRPHLGN